MFTLRLIKLIKRNISQQQMKHSFCTGTFDTFFLIYVVFIWYCRQNQFQLDVDMFGNLSHYSSNPPTPSAGTPATPTTPLYVNVNNMLVPVECLYYHVS